MASEILGLFTTPEDYQMRQQQAQQNRALQFAQLDPFERASYGIYKGAGQLAGAGAQLFGMQDPQLRMISQRQALSQEIDPSDPESIMRAARKAVQLNDQQFAFGLVDAARKMQSEMALAQQRGRIDVPDKIQAGREINKLVLQRENLLAQGNAATSPQVRAIDAEISSLQRVTRGEKIPDVIEISNRRAELQGEIDTLTAQQRDKPTAENAEKILTAKRQLEGLPLPGDKASTEVARDAQIEVIDRQLASPELSSQERANLEARRDRLLGAKEDKANIKEIGVAIGSNAPVYLDVNKNQQFIYKVDKDGNQIRVPYSEGVDRATSKTTVSVSQKGETAFAEKLGALDAKDVADARTLRDNSIAALNTLNELAELNKAGVISGTAATNRVSAANLLNTLGLISDNDKNILANSENYQKTSGDLILKTLGGRLGAGFSNEDRKFIAGLIPQLENSAQARRALIERMQKVNEKIVKETTRLEDYARDKNSLKGFKPDIPLRSTPTTSTNVKDYTRAELEAAIAKKKAEAAKSKGQ